MVNKLLDENDVDFDIIFLSPDGKTRCHLNVLKNISSFFISFKEKQECTIKFKQNTVKTALVYLYGGDFDITHDNIVELYNLSKEWKLHYMTNTIIQFLNDNLNSDNVSLYHTAVHEIEDLSTCIVNYNKKQSIQSTRTSSDSFNSQSSTFLPSNLMVPTEMSPNYLYSDSFVSSMASSFVSRPSHNSASVDRRATSLLPLIYVSSSRNIKLLSMINNESNNLGRFPTFCDSWTSSCFHKNSIVLIGSSKLGKEAEIFNTETKELEHLPDPSQSTKAAGINFDG